MEMLLLHCLILGNAKRSYYWGFIKMFKEWAVSQFEVKRINSGRNVNKICFRTPLVDYTLTPEVWELVKQKLNEV